MDGKELLQELLRRYPDQRVSEDPAGAGMLSSLGAQQPEPMTGAGLQTAGGSLTEEAAGAQVIGPEEIAKAGETLQKYKAGKASLDKRIVENELWFRMGHWKNCENKMMEGKPKPSSGWLFNSIANKHADAMDNYPEPNVLPRAADDEETAKVLSPEKKVLLPNLEAGCSLAESCDAAAFAAFKAKYPGYKVVSYVNTSVGVKALTDVCCTSSNALKVVESIPADQPIIFAPDRNLGSYIQKLTGRENMVIWDGACHVHEEFSLEKILELKRQHPAAQVVVHPECRAYIVQVADFVGSTAAILDYCGKSSAREFIVVTEAGILTEMKRRYPEKTFIPAPPDDEACGCNNCRYMKMITLENIFTTLRDEQPEISLDEEVRRRAERSILNMIAIK